MNPTKPRIFGLILAGGFSQRMGRDKALLEYHGKPQIEHVHDLLTTCCDKVFLSKRADQGAYKGFQSIDDAPEFSGSGPLGGILSAMKTYPGVTWLVMACDLPYVTQETLQTLLRLRDPQKTATAFISTQDGLPEPLCALWEAHGYAPIMALFQEGLRCPRKALIRSQTHLIQQTDPRWLDNINTLQEYEDQKKEFH